MSDIFTFDNMLIEYIKKTYFSQDTVGYIQCDLRSALMCNSITCVQVRTKREQNIHVFRNFSVSKYFNCFSTLSMCLEILKKPCKCVKYHKSVRLYIDIRTYLDRCSRKEIYQTFSTP